MSILWIILIGFLAGVLAKLIHPGPNEPSGFILTTLLGIAGAFVATYLGQAIGWYRADQGAGLIGATVGHRPIRVEHVRETHVCMKTRHSCRRHTDGAATSTVRRSQNAQ